jgi:hypothetical protein
MDTPDKTSKRLVVYDRKDSKKYYSLDISNAQVWELEPEDSDWDPIDCFPRQTTARTLYRLVEHRSVPGALATRRTIHWVLVEESSHFEAGSLGPPTCQALTDAQAAEQLVLSGHTPPEEIAHHVADKLTPPPVQPAALETPKSNRAEQITEKDWYDILGNPPVKKFGPVIDRYCGDSTTLFMFPSNRWILHTVPAYEAAGNRYTPLTENQATDWFLRNGLEVPQDLYEFLPAPTERQTKPQKESAPLPPESGQAPTPPASEDRERDVGQYVAENCHLEGTANPVRHQAPVVLCKYGEPVIVKEKPKELPSLPAYKLVKALLEAGDRGLSKGQLEPISTDYWRILKELKGSDPDWNAVIHFPGKPHGRYRIG